MEQLFSLVLSVFVMGYIVGLAFAMIFRQSAGATAFTRWYFRSIGRVIGGLLRWVAGLFDRRPRR